MASGKRAANLVFALILGCNGCVGPAKSHSLEPPNSTVAKSASSSAWNKPVTEFAASARKTLERGADSLSDRLKLKSDGMSLAQVVPRDDPTSMAYKPGPLGPDLYVAAARLAERQGRIDDAQQQYQRALQIDGRSHRALVGLARLQHRSGDMAKATETYQRAMEYHRNDPIIMNDLGLCHARNGQLDQAISLLRSAVALQPDRAMYRNNLAAALVEAKRPEEAVAYLSQTNNPAIAHYNVGYLLNRSGQAGQAAHYFDKALGLEPSLHQARTMLDQIAPQVSALPQPGRSEPSIPHTSAGAVKMPLPRDYSPGRVPATAPQGTPFHLRTHAHRAGPFGYVPPARESRVVQASYVDEAGFSPAANLESRQASESDSPHTLPVRMPRSSHASDSGLMVPPLPKG